MMRVTSVVAAVVVLGVASGAAIERVRDYTGLNAVRSVVLGRLMGRGSYTFLVSAAQAQQAGEGSTAAAPDVPRTWSARALDELELPIANLKGAKKHVAPEYYYRIPVRPVYKSYPVYAPGREPAGYKAWLRRQPPAIIFDAATLKTPEDWIAAGSRVFHSPIAYDVLVSEEDLKDERWYRTVQPPVASDGTIPFIRYGIREPGKIEVGILGCATCHSRVMNDGAVVDGAQGNFRYNAAIAWSYRMRQTLDFVRQDLKLIYGVPWMRPDPLAVLYSASIDEICRHEEAMPAGVIARNGTSPLFPTQVPNLIGVKDHAYLDYTGLVRHNGIGDLMRYMALAQGIDFVSSYGSFVPRAEGTPPKLPDPETLEAKRYSDEQLYAVASYLYSLAPPSNPHAADDRAKRGEQVFERRRCGQCHTPPLYTNNMLIPVDGFDVPKRHYALYRIKDLPMGTDPSLALQTRRATGYYKVPSLRGVWYREMLGHSGHIKGLESWFDPARLADGFVPSGFNPTPGKPFPVVGHNYGLDLSTADRAALIAFLRTLD